MATNGDSDGDREEMKKAITNDLIAARDAIFDIMEKCPKQELDLYRKRIPDMCRDWASEGYKARTAISPEAPSTPDVNRTPRSGEILRSIMGKSTPHTENNNMDFVYRLINGMDQGGPAPGDGSPVATKKRRAEKNKGRGSGQGTPSTPKAQTIKEESTD